MEHTARIFIKYEPHVYECLNTTYQKLCALNHVLLRGFNIINTHI